MPVTTAPGGRPVRGRRRFEPLLESVLPQAFGIALRLTGERAAAEDLVQQAALGAFRAFAALDPGTSFRIWFFRILLGTYRRSFPARRAESESVDWDDTPDLYLYGRSHVAGLPVAGADPAAHLLERLGDERVAVAIERLPERYRVVALLYFMDDFGYREIGEMLECPVGTVRSRLHRGRKMLQKALWQVAEEAGMVPPGGARSEGA